MPKNKFNSPEIIIKFQEPNVLLGIKHWLYNNFINPLMTKLPFLPSWLAFAFKLDTLNHFTKCVSGKSKARQNINYFEVCTFGHKV